MKKRILNLALICLLMMGTILSTSILANEGGGMVFKVDDVNMQPGEEKIVGIQISNNPGFNIVEFSLEFDKEKLELSEVTLGEMFLEEDSGKMFAYNEEKQKGAFISTESVKTSGEIFKLYFKAKESARGKIPVNLVLKYVKDNEGHDIETQSIAGEIDIKIPLEKIELDKNSDVINVGTENSKSLKVIYNPEDTTEDKKVTWESSNPLIAEVANGIVTGISPGNAIITAAVGGHFATYEVEVKAPLQSIVFGKESYKLILGDEIQTAINYFPENTTEEKNPVYRVEDSSIVEVDAFGKLKAKTIGKTKIFAEVNGKITSADVEVQANGKINITGQILGKNGMPLDNHIVELHSVVKKTVTDGNGYFTFEDADLGQHELIVKENNESEKVITQTKINIVKGEEQKAEPSKEENLPSDIIVNNDNKGVTLFFEIPEEGKLNMKNEVETGNKTPEEIHLREIKLNKESMTLVIDKSEALIVSFFPFDTTDDKTIQWTSLNPEIIEVDKNGMVTGIKKGEGTIKAKVGNLISECQISVLAGILGDVDGSGVIQAYDALLALQIATEKIKGTDYQKWAADVDGETEVSAYDALRILQFATGKIDKF